MEIKMNSKKNIYVIYHVRDNVSNAGHYRENKPRQGEQDNDAQGRRLASP